MIKIFIQSLKLTWNEKRMAALLWSVSFLIALPSFWTVQRSLNSYFSGRTVASEWLHEGFDFNHLLEMINDFPSITVTFNSVIAATLVLFVIASVFLAGGIIGRLRTLTADAPVTQGFSASFSHYGGSFFFRYLRVFLWTALLGFVSLVFMMIGGFASLLTIASIALWIVVADVTKVRLMTENSSQVTKTYFSSLVWVLKNFLPAAGLYLLNFLVLAVGFFIYKLLDNALTPDSIFMILLMFLWQQVFIFFRSAMKIQFLSCTLLLWNSRPVKLETPVAETPTVSENSGQIQPA